MSEPQPANDVGASLDPWRRASAFITTAQLPGVLALFPLVVFGDESLRTLAYAIAAAVVALETAEWAIARAALAVTQECRRLRSINRGHSVEGDRRVVGLGLALVPIVVVMLVTVASPKMFEGDSPLAAVVLVAAGLPGFLSLYRVMRHNSWLAVSWLPARARERGRGVT